MLYSDILSYLRVIRRRWWVIALLFGCTMAVVLLSSVTTKPVYLAQVKLQVLSAESQEVFLFSQFRPSGLVDEVRAAQTDFVRQLRSSYVARLTQANLGLGVSASELLSRLSVSTDGDYITLVVEADDPALAEGIAREQAQNALVEYRKVRSRPSATLLQFIDKQLKVEEDLYRRAEDALVAFKREHSLEDLNRELLNYQDSIRSLKQQVDQSTLQQQLLLARAAKERDEAKRLLEQATGATATAPYSAQYLREQATRLSNQAAEHEFEASIHAATAEEYGKLVAKRQQDMQELLSLHATYDALRRGVDQAAGNYNFLVSKYNEARLKQSQANDLGFIQIVEEASVRGQAASKLRRVAVVGAVVSILAGLVIVFVLEYLESVRKWFAGGRPSR